jgi:predicted AAA+ superfamily ATPase
VEEGKKIFLFGSIFSQNFKFVEREEYLEGALYEWVVQSHLQRKFVSVYYYRNKFEIDCIAGNLKIEVKVGKPHREYPKDVLILDSENLPLFLAVL